MRKIVTVIVSMLLIVCMLAGCSQSSGTNDNEKYKGQTVSGTVKEVGSDSITIEIGSPEMNGAPGGNENNGQAGEEADSQASEETNDQAAEESGEQPAEETSSQSGETAVFKISSDTEITKNSMGGPGNGGQPPEMPGSDSSSDTSSDSDSDSNSNANGSQPPQGQPPEKPSDDNSNGSSDGSQPPQGQPPEMPGNDSNGESNNGSSNDSNSNSDGNQPPEMPGNDSNGETIKLSDISEGDFVNVVIDEDGKVSSVSVLGSGMSGGQPGGSESSGKVEATGATTVDGSEETLNDTYESTDEDVNAVLVTNGGTLTSDGATIDKKSGDGSDTDSCDFHGVNAGLLVNGDSTATVTNATIKTSADCSNAVFCTGSNSKIEISDSTITTTGNSSCRGLDATNGGTIIADNMKITTQGGSCATLATDRGEGTVTVSDSELETNGAGSPLIYSTGEISIDNTTGIAYGSQITVVEGKNSATITNSDVTASGAGNRGTVDSCGVMLYQSMSGDADEGTASFTAEKSALTINKDSDQYKTAPMFFVTNTDAEISLTDTEISYGSGVLLSIKGTDEWGQSGSNGGTVKLTANSQTLEGDIEADDISEAEITLEDGSTYEGTINGDKTAKSITLKISKDSKVKLTGDTYVTALEDEDETYSNIDFNGYKLYVNGKAL